MGSEGAGTSPRAGGAATAGDAVRGWLDRAGAPAEGSRGMLSVWLSANGDLERAHTVGVYLREDPRGRGLPTLVVYVDSNACAVDFRAQGELYLARLQAAGASVGGVDFRLSRYAAQHRARRDAPRPDASPRRLLPPLSPADEALARSLVADLPEGHRERAFRAICASFRQDAWESSQDAEKGRR